MHIDALKDIDTFMQRIYQDYLIRNATPAGAKQLLKNHNDKQTICHIHAEFKQKINKENTSAAKLHHTATNCE